MHDSHAIMDESQFYDTKWMGEIACASVFPLIMRFSQLMLVWVKCHENIDGYRLFRTEKVVEMSPQMSGGRCTALCDAAGWAYAAMKDGDECHWCVYYFPFSTQHR